MNLQPVLEPLCDKFISSIKATAVGVPPMGDDQMDANNLKLLADRMAEGKIKQQFATGSIDEETGDLVLTLRLSEN